MALAFRGLFVSLLVLFQALGRGIVGIVSKNYDLLAKTLGSILQGEGFFLGS